MQPSQSGGPLAGVGVSVDGGDKFDVGVFANARVCFLHMVGKVVRAEKEGLSGIAYGTIDYVVAGEEGW